jgi:hypothetical protein
MHIVNSNGILCFNTSVKMALFAELGNSIEPEFIIGNFE